MGWGRWRKDKCKLDNFDIEAALEKAGHSKPNIKDYSLGAVEMQRYYEDLRHWRAKHDFVLVGQLNGEIGKEINIEGAKSAEEKKIIPL